jgi:protein gp37
MAQETGISWCDSTANLWIGCQKISPACDHCYADALMGTGERAPGERRMGRASWGPEGERSYCKQGWSDLRKWNRAAERNGGVDPELGRRRWVFINSLSDFFDSHPSVTWRPEAWQLFRECPHLILILVTKRPHLIARELPELWDEIAGRVILMTTAEDQEWADRRIRAMFGAFEGINHPAAFAVSGEPLLGALDLTAYMPRSYECGASCGLRLPGPPEIERCTECGEECGPATEPVFSEGCPKCGGELEFICPDCDHYMVEEHPRKPDLGWVIVGGETGGQARPIHPAWVETIEMQCRRSGVAFHLKQWGEFIGRPAPDSTWKSGDPVPPDLEPVTFERIGKAKAGRLLHGVEHLARPEL